MRTLIAILFLSFIASIASAQNVFCPQNANCTISGNNTHSGTENFTNLLSTGNLNNILIVDGVQYASIAAAITAAGSNNRIILVPSTYSGTECPSVPPANVALWDFRGLGPGNLPCGSNTDTWNGQTPGVFSFLRHSWSVTNPLNKSYELTTNDADYSGTLPASTNSLQGITTVARLVGSVTIPNANTAVVGLESHGEILSTGGTLGFLYGHVTGNQLLAGSTTNVTNSYALRIQNLINLGSGTVTNNYGVLFDTQTGGATRNFSWYTVGAGLFASDASSTGINFEDSALATHPVITALSATNEMRFRPLLDSAGFCFENIASSVAWLCAKSAAVTIPTLNLQVGQPVQNIGGTATMGLTFKKGSGGGNYTTASTTYVVVDSTNLCNTVTIPTGWKLSISLSGAIGTATAAVLSNVALTDNAACGTANAGILVESVETTTAAGVLQPFALNWVINGDGNAHNVALQYKTSAGADSATILNSSATSLPTMVFTLMPSN